MTGSTENPILPLDHLALRGEDSAEALVLRGEVLDYKALRTRVSRLAAWLARVVPEKGARVASWAAKGELTCLLPLAAARAGLVHVPVNPLLKHAQVAHILADSGALVLIGTPSRLASLGEGDVPAACRIIEEGAALAEAAENCRPPRPIPTNWPRFSIPVAPPAARKASCSAMPTCGWGQRAWPNTWASRPTIALSPCCRCPSITGRTSCFQPGMPGAV
jgi:non-ribosomal peptide synthetase component F